VHGASRKRPTVPRRATHQKISALVHKGPVAVRGRKAQRCRQPRAPHASAVGTAERLNVAGQYEGLGALRPKRGTTLRAPRAKLFVLVVRKPTIKRKASSMAELIKPTAREPNAAGLRTNEAPRRQANSTPPRPPNPQAPDAPTGRKRQHLVPTPDKPEAWHNPTVPAARSATALPVSATAGSKVCERWVGDDSKVSVSSKPNGACFEHERFV
jgi:hypothetical protein